MKEIDKENALQVLESMAASAKRPSGLLGIFRVALLCDEEYQKELEKVYVEAIRQGAEALAQQKAG